MSKNTVLLFELQARLKSNNYFSPSIIKCQGSNPQNRTLNFLTHSNLDFKENHFANNIAWYCANCLSFHFEPGHDTSIMILMIQSELSSPVRSGDNRISDVVWIVMMWCGEISFQFLSMTCSLSILPNIFHYPTQLSSHSQPSV